MDCGRENKMQCMIGNYEYNKKIKPYNNERGAAGQRGGPCPTCPISGRARGSGFFCHPCAFFVLGLFPGAIFFIPTSF